MNTRFHYIIITSLALSPFAFGAGEDFAPTDQGAGGAGTNQSARAASISTARQISQTSTNAEPTELEMREAVQRHLDGINAQMRPPPAAPSSPSTTQPYVYSPYRRYYGYGYGYHRYGKDSDYENWTDVAKRAAATARVQITSFKKIRCTPAPDEGGFLGVYVAELELRGNNPAAQDIMQTSGKRLEGFFYRGDKGWIFGEAKTETK